MRGVLLLGLFVAVVRGPNVIDAVDGVADAEGGAVQESMDRCRDLVQAHAVLAPRLGDFRPDGAELLVELLCIWQPKKVA